MKLFTALKWLRRQPDPVVSSLNLTLSPDWKPEPKEEEDQDDEAGSPGIIPDDLRNMQSELSDLESRFAEVHKGVSTGSVWEMEYEYVRQRKKWWIGKAARRRAFSLDWLMETKNRVMDSLGPAYEELHQRLDRACHFYLNANGLNRKLLRGSIANQRKLREALVDHPTWCARHIKLPSDQMLLKTGLAAASLEDTQLDFRDTLCGLAALYLASINAGINPGQDFAAVASLSSSKQRPGGSGSTRRLLKEFEKTAFFEETVATKLKGSR
ncbi:MAG TPA: hypothetical protein VI636_21290 [Candidatus Angelobacter sp.]